MRTQRRRRRPFPTPPKLVFAGVLLGASLGGCVTPPSQETEGPAEKSVEYTAADKDCLVRAMYFESNRSSDDGLLAIGSVVMNRVNSGTFPNTICGVVGQRGQFVATVLTMPMQKRDQERVERIAEEVLAGKRHPKIANAMYFHVAGLRFHYGNMRYVLVAGGNAFYERVQRRNRPEPSTTVTTTAASAE